MKIVIISNNFVPETGAAASRIRNMAEGLSAKGAEVEVVCAMPNYPKGRIFEGYRGRLSKRERMGALKIFRYWIYPSNSKNAILRILSMLSFSFSLWAYLFSRSRMRRADWVIVQSPPLLMAFSAIVLFKKLLRRKLILNVSDIWPLTAFEMGAMKKGRFYRFLESVERYTYRNADLILGQTEGILNHVNGIYPKPHFLYRNLQPSIGKAVINNKGRNKPLRVVYAGLLGVAQGVYDIVSGIDFSQLGAELDIYGHGNEKENIGDFLTQHPNRGIAYKGSVSEQEINALLPEYDVSLIPLAFYIPVAAPSKLIKMVQFGLPVIYYGDGEGAGLVEKHALGITSRSGNLEELIKAIERMAGMPDADFRQLKYNCTSASKEVFNFENQMESFYSLLNTML